MPRLDGANIDDACDPKQPAGPAALAMITVVSQWNNLHVAVGDRGHKWQI